MTDVYKGIAAGAIATTALSLAMLAQNAAGILPSLSLVQLLLNLLDAPHEHALGWILHFAIGSGLLGGSFALIEPHLKADSHVKSGVLFGVILWLGLMLVFMPAAKAGYFGFQLTKFAPLVMLLLTVWY